MNSNHFLFFRKMRMLLISNIVILQTKLFSVFLMDTEAEKLPFSVISITNKFYSMEELSLNRTPRRRKNGWGSLSYLLMSNWESPRDKTGLGIWDVKSLQRSLLFWAYWVKTKIKKLLLSSPMMRWCLIALGAQAMLSTLIRKRKKYSVPMLAIQDA